MGWTETSLWLHWELVYAGRGLYQMSCKHAAQLGFFLPLTFKFKIKRTSSLNELLCTQRKRPITQPFKIWSIVCLLCIDIKWGAFNRWTKCIHFWQIIPRQRLSFVTSCPVTGRWQQAKQNVMQRWYEDTQLWHNEIAIKQILTNT